jgi:hypothetical protein
MEIKKIKDIINNISVSLSFVSCNYTVQQKILMCQSFIEVLEEYPDEMSQYLIKGVRGSALQNKIFKKYLSLLENSLPFTYTKGKDKYVINSITDKNLNIFIDTQEFEQFVNSHFKIKNNTQEIYIGGRKASYVKPYYIGKLLDVIDIKRQTSILNKVDDYTFSYVKINDVAPGTKVKVVHLAIPPHYQMGPMVYLNRIKTEIKKML